MSYLIILREFDKKLETIRLDLGLIPENLKRYSNTLTYNELTAVCELCSTGARTMGVTATWCCPEGDDQHRNDGKTETAALVFTTPVCTSLILTCEEMLSPIFTAKFSVLAFEECNCYSWVGWWILSLG